MNYTLFINKSSVHILQDFLKTEIKISDEQFAYHDNLYRHLQFHSHGRGAVKTRPLVQHRLALLGSAWIPATHRTAREVILNVRFALPVQRMFLSRIMSGAVNCNNGQCEFFPPGSGGFETRSSTLYW